jgi:phenylpropionate dioxygenase-like ring-hydroxylating dioxygenase large terminal subunit
MRLSQGQDTRSPATMRTRACLSRDYVEAECDWLWRKSWLQAGWLQDFRNDSDFLTFDIHDDSVIIVREGDNIRALHNICVHRWLLLFDTPTGKARCPIRITNRKS